MGGLQPLLRKMVDLGGSDLFVTAGLAPRMRVNGRLQPMGISSLTVNQAADLVASTMNEHQRAEFGKTKEANFGIDVEAIGRFRVSAYYQLHHPAMVLRRIKTQIPTVADLELPAIVEKLSLQPSGLVCVVGPAGSGKSTTLAAMIGHHNVNCSDHIICIEDSIEFVHRHEGCIISQREVGIDTESYPIALRNARRQAPNVLLVGEIRQRDTVEQALAFAETGRLCLTTLHGNSASKALERLTKFFPKHQREALRLDLAASLSAIVAQRLIPRIDRPGRIVATEILLNTPLVADLIAKGEIRAIDGLISHGEEQGMKSFDQCVFELYAAGFISQDNAQRFASSPDEVRRMIRLEGEAAGL